MNILIAPNAFKNSLNATAAAKAIGEGLLQSKLPCSIEYFPVGDGGDGTAELIIQKQNGKTINVETHDALGRKIKSSYGLIDDERTAVVELANASGIKLLKTDELNPLHATTFGTGELIKHALDKKVRKIILCIGGSATVDGGIGILRALGIKFLNDKNKLIEIIPKALPALSFIDTSEFDKRVLSCELVILCDVENTLLGNNGAAKIFGPQKGASEDDIIKLEAALTVFNAVTLKQTGIDMSAIKHGGAAGGVAAGLAAYCNAKLVNGIEYFLSITGFEKALQKADIVITGEGKIDAQTLQGKGPYGVAVKAKEKNIPVIGAAGNVPLENNKELQQYFDVLFSINNEATDINTAMQHTKANLIRTGAIIGKLISISQKIKAV
ncbi:glycerate kinase [Parafilimonas terrae]|uniref:Glycerate kinase n=1 Tax=Parafilimonas terrae TaxID=1465490 RepID=A0A1I5V9N4_9BACT|nr:glycerate kinase [Parafilimonas terrae]SFQ04122.1 glycerate kinase [Parafilimonas terrae]